MQCKKTVEKFVRCGSTRNSVECDKAMQLSRTMIHWIKTGRYEVTQKNWVKLEKVEPEAGFLEVAESDRLRRTPPGEIKTAVVSAAEKAKVRIGSEDMDRGVVEVPLISRRGEPPPGLPFQGSD